MEKIWYGIQRAAIVPLLYVLSWLPLWLLYRISDGIAFLLQYIIRYRRKVILANFRHVFPDKSDEEYKRLLGKFYRHFADIIVETLKLLTITEPRLRKMISVSGLDILRDFSENDQSIFIALGHSGNWELFPTRTSIEGLFEFKGVYRPLSNPVIDRITLKARTRHGVGVYNVNNLVRSLLKDRNKLTSIALVGDQKPHQDDIFWVEFMGVKTPAHKGIGKLSRIMKYPVVFMSIKRTDRGRYHMNFERLVDQPELLEEIEIVQRFFDKLEEVLLETPEQWLWSHRRWRKRPDMEHDIYGET